MISFDGADIHDIALDVLRGGIGYVPQDNFLFSEAIAENIRFYAPEATMEDIEQAAKLADIYDSIQEFPDGFQTQVGERGVTLSGGQKQRISIARALVKRPRILILDDALSAVDAKTEQDIWQSLRGVFAGGTSGIIVAHRVSALQNCDEILVLERGASSSAARTSSSWPWAASTPAPRASRRAGRWTTMNKNRRGLSRLLPFLRPQLKTLLLCLLMVLLVNAAELAKPYILEVVIDRYLTAGRPDQGLDAVWVLALGYMACVALSSVLNVSEAVMVNRMGQSILMDIRRRVFNHIQHMSMKTLDHFSSGRLITRATNDVETLNELFSDVLVNLFKDVFMLLGIVVMMLWMNWRLALVAFAVVPLIALITILVRGRLRRNFVRLKALTGQINGFFSENMSGMRLVQIFRKEKEKHAEFDELNYGYYKAARLQVRMNSLMRPLVEVVNQLGVAILVWYGCGQIGLGTLEIGMLYAFTNYIKQFFEPINDLAEKYTTVSSAVVSTDRIFELLDDESQLEDTVTGKPLETVEGRVEFQHVWFAYEGEKLGAQGRVLHDRAGAVRRLCRHDRRGKVHHHLADLALLRHPEGPHPAGRPGHRAVLARAAAPARGRRPAGRVPVLGQHCGKRAPGQPGNHGRAGRAERCTWPARTASSRSCPAAWTTR